MIEIQRLLIGTIIQNGFVCFPLSTLGISENASAECIVAAIFLKIGQYFNDFIDTGSNNLLTTENGLILEYVNEYPDILMYCFWWQPYIVERNGFYAIRRELIIQRFDENGTD
jgi:hypothetical protein